MGLRPGKSRGQSSKARFKPVSLNQHQAHLFIQVDFRGFNVVGFGAPALHAIAVVSDLLAVDVGRLDVSVPAPGMAALVYRTSSGRAFGACESNIEDEVVSTTDRRALGGFIRSNGQLFSQPQIHGPLKWH